MSQPYFSALLPQLAQRAADATVNVLGYSNTALREHLREVFGNPIGVDGCFVGDPTFEATFSWEEGEKPFGDFGIDQGGFLSPSLIRNMARPPASLAKDYTFGSKRHPYTHQAEAWELLSRPSPQSVVVASGTGSGKTECFIVPVLNDLALEAETSDEPLEGVRALFLYPLNALINSQRERLAAWTAGFGDSIRFCLYNGETEEQAKPGGAEWPSEVADRKALRASPPPILVTNSTMLEFMLVRAQDEAILRKSAGTLRWIVLDEAHSYIGSQAAELALLLRRVLHGFGVSPESVRFVATSATIGDPRGEAGLQLRRFLADVGGIPIDNVHIVAGSRDVPRLERPPTTLDDLEQLAAISPEVTNSQERYDALVANRRARAIRAAMLRPDYPNVAKLSEIRGALRAVDGREYSETETLAWLDVLSSTRNGEDEAFLPVRGHIMHQTLPGLWACVDRNCSARRGPLQSAEWPFGAVYRTTRQFCECGSPCYEAVSCEPCGAVHLLGFIAGDSVLQFEDREPVDEFELHQDAAAPEGDAEDDEDEALTLEARVLICGGTPESGDRYYISRERECLDAPVEGACEVAMVADAGQGLTCPRCQTRESRRREVFRSARIGGPLLLSTIVPTLLEFAPDTEPALELPSRGRRILAFNDSRQGTARAATRLQQDAERTHVRGLIYHHVLQHRSTASSAKLVELRNEIQVYEKLIADVGPKPELIQLKQEKLARVDEILASGVSFETLRANIASTNSDLQRMLRTYQHYAPVFEGPEAQFQLAGLLLAREFARRPRRLNSLETMGMVAVYYPALAAVRVAPPAWLDAGLGVSDWQDFLKTALDHTVRGGGSVALPIPWHRWLGMQWHPNALLPIDRDKRRRQRNWPSVSKSGRQSMLVRLLADVLHLQVTKKADADRIDSLMRAAWLTLRECGLLEPQGDGTGHMLPTSAMSFRIVDKAWLCPVTRRFLDTTVIGFTPYLMPGQAICAPREIPVYPHAFGGGTPSFPDRLAQARDWLTSTSAVRALRSDALWSDLHDRIVELMPYYATAEHSAQQSSKRLKAYETQFKRGDINLLSCSTTMEMGIDIGGISMTAMNNVPPHPANYLQRAGRAGRRGELRSCAVTLTKSNPHDQAVFADSSWAFNRKMHAPVVSLSSSVIAQRHVNAFVLGRYLKSLILSENLHKLTTGWFFANVEQAPVEQFAAFCRSESTPKLHRMADGLRILLRGSVFESVAHEDILEQTAQLIVLKAESWRPERRALAKSLDGAQSSEIAARAVQFQIKRLDDEYLLRELSTCGFLPVHGFPTSIAAFDPLTQEEFQRLAKVTKYRQDNLLRRRDLTSRDLPTALREYAPGSDVVIDGRVFTSAGITLNWHIPASESEVSEVQSLRYAWWCNRCGASGSEVTLDRASNCRSCGEETAERRCFLEPAGFAVDFSAGEPHNDVSRTRSQLLAPEWVSADGPWTDLQEGRIGRSRASNRGHVYYHSAGQSGFGYAVCLVCGRAASMPGPSILPTVFLAPHSRLRGGGGQDRICEGTDWSIKSDIELGHKTFTDILELQLRDRSGAWLQRGKAAETLALVLRNAVARKLGVQLSELDCATRETLGSDGKRTASLLIFDRNAAGYATAVATDVSSLFVPARQMLLCSVECDSACSACVLDFDQRHDAARLDRHAALEFLTDDWCAAIEN